MSSRHVVLAVARPRSQWMNELTRWASSGSVAIDVTRCISIDEVRARLSSLQAISAIVVDERCVGLDRDLLAAAHDAGSASIIVTSPDTRRDWTSIGASCALAEPLDRDAFVRALRAHAPTVERAESVADLRPAEAPSRAGTGRVVAITGGGGTGTSTVAIAAAQAFATSGSASVALVDAALQSSLALLLHSPDVVPGLQEFVETHRLDPPAEHDIRAMLRPCTRHGFELLTGLRRHRDWTTLRPRAIAAAVDSLRRCYEDVVIDLDPDLEGEVDTGSFDIADRNALARHVTSIAELVIVTGRPDLVGLDRLVRAITDLLDHGVSGSRIMPVVLHAGRQQLPTRAVRSSLDALLDEIRPGADVVGVEVIELPVGLDAIQLDGTLLPAVFVDALRARLDHMLEAVHALPFPPDAADAPQRVQPGSLGIAS